MMTKTPTREDKVAEFHKHMKLDLNSQARASLVQLRSKLIQEEALEVVQALQDVEVFLHRGLSVPQMIWADLLKELGDLQYVLSGTIVSLKPINGPFDVAFNRIHDSNMSKLDDNNNPIYNEDGKVLKGPNYKAPNLIDLIA